MSKGVVFSGTVDAIQILHTQRRILLRQAEIEGYRPFTGGHVLSGCPAILYNSHASIVHKATSCTSSGLPPPKKPRLQVGLGPKALSPAPHAPRPVHFLCNVPGDIGARAGIGQELAAGLVEALLSEKVQRVGSHIQEIPALLGGDVWILGGVCYGFATDKSRTGPILDAVLDRIFSQPVGPRFVAGDWNLEVQELPQLALLRARGFIDIQDLRAARTGEAVEPTCKGKTRKDFLFVSPELQATFLAASVDPTFWPDHSVVSASFGLPRDHLVFFSWRQPVPRTSQAVLEGQVHFSASAGDSTERYAQVCHSYEEALSRAEQREGRPPLSAAERGRGRVQEVRCRKTFVVPHRKGRQGDVEPNFFGCHVQHGHWFRQLRRVQALVQSMQRGQASPAGLDHRMGLWRAILRAPGFQGSFQSWWQVREVQLAGDFGVIPEACPQLAVCQQLFLSLEANFWAFEARLLQRLHEGLPTPL